MQRILVLEDDDDLRERLSEILQEEGYQVESSSNGADALARSAATPYDLLVTDVRMAGMDGLEALQKVQLQQPSIASLVITGYATEADSVRAIRLGVGDYLRKPFQIEDFLEAVERLLARRRAAMREQAREQALRKTMRVALESLARTVDMESWTRTVATRRAEDETILGVSHLSRRLAGHLGLNADAVGLATLVAGLEALAPELQPTLIIEALSAEERRLVTAALGEEVEEDWPDLEVVRACLARLRGDEVPEGLREAMEAVTKAPVEERVRDRSASRLSLARVLAASGEREAALHGYQEVLRDAEATPDEHGAALLGLARGAWVVGKGHSESWARAAAGKAPEMSLRAAAETHLEAGLILLDRGLDEGAELLEKAARGFERLHLPIEEAQARLCLARARQAAPSDELLAPLLEPDARHQLAACAWFLLPWLLEHKSPRVTRFLRIVARDFPREMEKAVRKGELSPEARQQAAEAIRQFPTSSAAQSALSLLGADPDAAVREAGGEAVPPLLRIYAFGGFEVRVAGEPVEEKSWRGYNPRFLLARLAAANGHAVAVDVLYDIFWPDETQDRARRNLNWVTSSLRRVLRPEGWKGDLDYVVRTDLGLQLNMSLPVWHDVSQFKAYLEAGDKRSALALYRGPFLEGCYQDWALQLRDELERQVTELLRQMLQESLDSGQYVEASDYGHRLLALDACCQEAYLGLMKANLALGRPEEAVRLYETCKKKLRKELGIEPSTDILREHQRALLVTG